MFTLHDTNGTAWRVSFTGKDAQHFVFALDANGDRRVARLRIGSLMTAHRARRWIEFWSGVDIRFDERQHVSELLNLAVHQ
jgi:hypothetical protein